MTAYLIQRGRLKPIQFSEGALGGLFSGVVGAIGYAALSVPIQFLILPLQPDVVAELFQSTADMPPEVRELLENLGSSGILMTVLIGFIAMLLVGMIFSAFGGLLGAFISRSSPLEGTTLKTIDAVSGSRRLQAFERSLNCFPAFVLSRSRGWVAVRPDAWSGGLRVASRLSVRNKDHAREFLAGSQQDVRQSAVAL